MAKFTYNVRDAQGRLMSGTMDANSVDECVGRLEETNLIPISIEELNFDGSIKDRTVGEKINEWLLTKQNKVPYKITVFFTRQLATMINGGVSLPKAIEQLGRNETHVAFKRIIAQIGDSLAMGSTFSDTLAKHPQIFDNMFVSVIRAGEVAGALDKVLNQLADYMENAEALRGKVKAATRYPLVITTFVGVIIMGILIFLVPVFQDMYGGAGQQLPVPTQILITISNAIRYNALAVALTIAAIIVSAIAVLTLVDGVKFIHDKIKLKMPIFGLIIRKNILSIYCRTTSLLMSSGTPILEATQIAGAAVNNKYYAQTLEQVYGDLKQGELLSAALTRAGEFPPLITQLVSTGEESGRIDELLQKAAEFYEREIRNTVDGLASIIEPVLIVAVGGIVGAMLIALYLPVFSIGKLMQ